MTTTLAERTRQVAVRVARTTQVERPASRNRRRPHRDPVREHAGPRFVPELDRVTTRLLALHRELPDVQIHFATTSLPQPAVIRAVDAFGASFAVSSRGEIDHLEREGVAIGRCLHTRPVKPVADITGAYLRGIRTFVVDTAAEVAKFRELPDVAVLVRLSPSSRAAKFDPESTSGASRAEAADLVGQCLRAGLRVAGFTIHVGNRRMTAAPWARAIRSTLALMRRLEHAHGIRFDTLDIGAVLPVADDEPEPGVDALARGIRAALAHAPSRYRVIVEADAPE